MDDYGLVLNAGSSSLKFCVFVGHVKQEWQLAARGQIDGIGTSPKLSVKDDAGAKLADEKLDASVKDGKAALAVLAEWLKARWGGSKVLGVGHRVVHGGAKYAGPSIVTPEVLEDLRTLIPWRRSISRTTSARSRPSPNCFPVCRRSPASTPASIGVRPRWRS